MSILDWQLMGDFFKVLAWPIGFILLAKGKGRFYILTEIAWNVLYCTAVYIGWKHFKIEITGIAFLLAYIIYIFLLFIVIRQVLSFKWSSNVWRYIFFISPLLILSFLNVRYLHQGWQVAVGVLLTGIAACFSYQHLKKSINFGAFFAKVGIFKK